MPKASKGRGRPVLARILVLVGMVSAIVGVLGLVFGWGSSSSSTAAPPSETPSAFLAAFVKAVHDGGGAFLDARYDLAVIRRYGAQQCHAATPGLFDPTFALQLVRVSGPQTFGYASDGKSTSVANVFAFDVRGIVRGVAATRRLHFALLNGRFRTFADCGNPVAGS